MSETSLRVELIRLFVRNYWNFYGVWNISNNRTITVSEYGGERSEVFIWFIENASKLYYDARNTLKKLYESE